MAGGTDPYAQKTATQLGTPIILGAQGSGNNTWTGLSTATSQPANGTLYLIPVVFDIALKVGMAVNISTAGSVGAVAHLGLYSDTNGKPLNLFEDLGTVAATAAAIVATAVGSTAITAGKRYWAGVVTQGGPATLPIYLSETGSFVNMPLVSGHAGPTSAQNVATWSITGITGALPATLGALTFSTATEPPLIGFVV